MDRPEAVYVCQCGQITDYQPSTCTRCYRKGGWQRLDINGVSRRDLIAWGAELAMMVLDWNNRQVTSEYQRVQLVAWWEQLRKRLSDDTV